MLGFREATWGTGLGITGGIATARQMGDWGIGLGASYRQSSEFEPTDGDDLKYQPGNEARVRLGLDRNVGEGGKFTAGVTFLNYSQDQARGRNFFQAGNRVRVDASYAFRSGASTWSLFAANSWRAHGDLTLDVVDAADNVVGDSLIVVGGQNLFISGLRGSVPSGPSWTSGSRPGRTPTAEAGWRGAGSISLSGSLQPMTCSPASAFRTDRWMPPPGNRTASWEERQASPSSCDTNTSAERGILP
jgi:hypothetical protein